LSSATVIDLQSYRERRAAAPMDGALQAVPATAPVFWTPVWVMMPVYVPAATGHDQTA
jgi:hypothetical protein